MKPLTAQGIVDAWSRGKKSPHYQRPLALLSVALPDADPGDLLDLSLGRRDALLLTLRSKTFGRVLTSYASCAHCQATLHFDLDVEEILGEGVPDGAELAGTLTHGGFDGSVRPRRATWRSRRPPARPTARASCCCSDA